jgi:hypothetical protein
MCGAFDQRGRLLPKDRLYRRGKQQKRQKMARSAHKKHPLNADLRKFAESARFAWETTGFEE